VSEERTEAATPKRRAEVRRRGQSSRSHDLTTAIVLLAGLYGVRMLAGSLADRLSAMVVGSILSVGRLDKSAPPGAGVDVFGVLYAVLPSLLGLMAVAAVLAAIAQGGFVFAPGLLAPKFERINPWSGAKRILSVQGLMHSGKTLGKLAAVAAVGFFVVQGHMSQIAGLGSLELLPAVGAVLDFVWEIAFKSALAMVALGVADYLWERRRFLKSIRMTRQEVREEYRQSEGDPQVRARLRHKREQLFQQMMKSVRTADVVITNPTHFAVALKYDQGTMAAPTVIARGQDFLAQRIRDDARAAGVPVLENPPLARALYRMVPVGSQIPAELFVAVAEVLAFVFRLRQDRVAL